MSEFPENIRQMLYRLVPASVLANVVCYLFYDNHPKNEKNIDVTVCTRMGEIKEYFQRDLVSSIKLDVVSEPSEIKILRNNNCDLFYLVVAKHEITILSRKAGLCVHQVVKGIEKYDISDDTCSGQPSLRIFRIGDAVPLVFDDNFENFRQPDVSMTFTESENDESMPIITHLMRKLTEAKYSVMCNEKTLGDFLDIHQAVAFSSYKKIHPNLDDSAFKDGYKEMARALKMNTQTPWTKTCNKKLVIVLNVCNMNNEPLEDVHILLHGAASPSIEYTTKLFEKSNISPFWEESETQTLKCNVETAIVVVMDLDDIKSRIVSKIEFNGVIFYKMMEKECLLPNDEVKLSSLETMGEEFDAISKDPIDNTAMLAVLATSNKTELILRHIKRHDDQDLTLDIFCQYLQMEKLPHCENVAIHRKSPYHTLNGVMIIISKETDGNNSLLISVYSRIPSQVLALIHYIHDTVPLTIVITTPNHKITAKDEQLSKYNEEILEDTQVQYNYQNYATSILNRNKLVLQYLDNCMIKMGESKDPAVQSKIGSEIDLFAAGDVSYAEFKSKMREEAAKGVKTVHQNMKIIAKSDEMYID